MVKKILVCALACLSVSCHVCSAKEKIKKDLSEVVQKTIVDETEKVVTDSDLDIDDDVCDYSADEDDVEDEVLLNNSLLDESQEESLFDAIEETEHDNEFQERFHRLKMYWAIMIFKVRSFFKNTVPSWFARKKQLEDNNN
jgi:hypothetical protein